MLTKEQRREGLEERIRKDLVHLNGKSPSAIWLNSNFQFEPNHTLSPCKRTIANKLLDILLGEKKGYKIIDKQNDLESICSNLLKSDKLDRPFSISMNESDWRFCRYWRAGGFLIVGIKLLLKGGFIHMKKGYYFTKAEFEYFGDYVRQTRIWPTKKLIELFSPFGLEDIQFSPAESINLKSKRIKADKRKGRKAVRSHLINYMDTPETRKVRNKLRKINLINANHMVQEIPKGRRGMANGLETNLHASYTGDFDHGGRLYTATEWGYQTLNEVGRATILIDNKRTVELDFAGYQPRILYAWKNIQYNDDPYTIIQLAEPVTELDDRNYDRDKKKMRNICKKAFMALLNSENEIKAVQAGNQLLYDHRDYYNLLRKLELTIKDGIIPAFKQAHIPIAEYFCKEEGLKVMNFDAMIALEILKRFTDKDIPILAIHDSFIVWQYLEQELKEVMQDVYSQFTGGFSCPIKVIEKAQIPLK